MKLYQKTQISQVNGQLSSWTRRKHGSGIKPARNRRRPTALSAGPTYRRDIVLELGGAQNHNVRTRSAVTLCGGDTAELGRQGPGGHGPGQTKHLRCARDGLGQRAGTRRPPALILARDAPPRKSVRGAERTAPPGEALELRVDGAKAVSLDRLKTGSPETTKQAGSEERSRLWGPQHGHAGGRDTKHTPATPSRCPGHHARGKAGAARSGRGEGSAREDGSGARKAGPNERGRAGVGRARRGKEVRRLAKGHARASPRRGAGGARAER